MEMNAIYKYLWLILFFANPQVGIAINDEWGPNGDLTYYGTENWGCKADDCYEYDGLSYQILNEDTKQARVINTFRQWGWAEGLISYDRVDIQSTFSKNGETYTVTTLGSSTLENVYGEVSLPPTITFIEGGNFNHGGYEKIVFPENLICLGSYCGLSNRKLSSTIFPPKLQYIQNNCFCNNPLLCNIIFNNGLISIGANSFKDNENIKEILLPSSLRELGEGCFENCIALEKIRIPRYLHFESMGQAPKGVFNGCPNIKIIESEVTFPTVWNDSFNEVDKSNCIVIVPDECSKFYESNAFWKEFKIVERSQYYTNRVENFEESTVEPNGMYSLSGIKINNNVLNRGEMYFEKVGDKIIKKILN